MDNVELMLAADFALEWLKNATDEELFAELEVVDGAVGYAINGCDIQFN